MSSVPALVLAAMSGISTFENTLRSRNIVVHSDNTVAENSVRKGSAKCFDHTAIVHSVWTKILELGANMYVVRVASKENLSDDPSRERYGPPWFWVLLSFIHSRRILQRYGLLARMAKALGVTVKAVAPVLEERFADAQSWESLAVTAHRAWMAQKAPTQKDIIAID